MPSPNYKVEEIIKVIIVVCKCVGISSDLMNPEHPLRVLSKVTDEEHQDLVQLALCVLQTEL